MGLILGQFVFAPEPFGRHDYPDFPGTAILNLKSFIPSRQTRRAMYYRAAARLGAYRGYGPADFGEVRRFVFICKGNICRSPFAEAVARAAGAKAVSYGLDARVGLQADSSAISAAKRLGFSMVEHRTKPFSEAVLEQGDLMIAMEPNHLRRIKMQQARPSDRLVLLAMWFDPTQPCIFDPYGMPDSDFDRCFDIIERATCRLIQACGVAPISRPPGAD